MTYIATIKHHTISSAPVINAGDTLTAAKRNATRYFGDGFLDHTIVIMAAPTPANPGGIVASKKIGGGNWQPHA